MLCHGCGHAWQLAADYARKKAQCPECGVFCEVPEETPRQAAPAAAARGRVADDLFLHDDRKAKPVEIGPGGVGDCPHCGETVRFTPGRKGRPRTCPSCEGPVLDSSIQKAVSQAPVTPPVATPVSPPYADMDAASAFGEETPYRFRDAPTTKPAAVPKRPEEGALFGEDSYGLVGGGHRNCPNCSMMMEDHLLKCPRCACNMLTGEMPAKTYEPVDREWESGMPYRRRLTIFLVAEGVFVAFGLIGAIMADELLMFFLTWQLFTALFAFIIGTYIKLHLKRSERGRVTMTETWRICLIPRPTRTIPLSEYEGVLVHNERDSGFWDWLVFAFLFPFGIVPSLFWFWFFIHQDKFVVSLCKDHGFPEKTIFRGMSETMAKDIAATIQDAVGFP
jgi:hypothetical protein